MRCSEVKNYTATLLELQCIQKNNIGGHALQEILGQMGLPTEELQ